LALRCNAPIFVAEKVMDEAGRVFSETGESSGPDDKPEKDTGWSSMHAGMKALSGVELLHRDLETAVKDERYEDAARIRDEIERLKKNPTGN
jgi:bifunctional DNase/RNase